MKGLRFRKTIKLLPGVQINLSKTGASVSIGPKGARVILGRGRPQVSLDLPGTGIYFRRALGSTEDEDETKATKKDANQEGKDKKGTKEKDQKQEEPRETPKPVVNLGLLNRLTTPPDELELVSGLQELANGNEDAAYAHLQKATSLPDGAFLAGFLALKRGEANQAIAYLNIALAGKDRLGQHYVKYKINPTVDLPVTEDVVAQIGPDLRGVLFALAEAYQAVGMLKEAIDCQHQIYQSDPHDLIVRLSLAELYSEAYPDDPEAQKHIVELAEGVRNETPVHASLMYYRAQALRKLGLHEAALDTLTQALRRKKDYPEDILLALRYERALVYEATGQTKRAQSEFQKIYAEAPTFEDVAAKVGV